jgi:hypothetical protein
MVRYFPGWRGTSYIDPTWGFQEAKLASKCALERKTYMRAIVSSLIRFSQSCLYVIKLSRQSWRVDVYIARDPQAAQNICPLLSSRTSLWRKMRNVLSLSTYSLIPGWTALGCLVISIPVKAILVVVRACRKEIWFMFFNDAEFPWFFAVGEYYHHVSVCFVFGLMGGEGAQLLENGEASMRQFTFINI